MAAKNRSQTGSQSRRIARLCLLESRACGTPEKSRMFQVARSSQNHEEREWGGGITGKWRRKIWSG